MEKYSGIVALIVLLVALVFFIKYQANHIDDDEQEVEEVKPTKARTSATPLDVNDEDAVVASLIASIELRNETHKNVEVISVRRVG